MKFFKNMTLQEAKKLYDKTKTQYEQCKKNNAKKTMQFYKSILFDLKFFTNNFKTNY